jgi:Omp85 superfamily domain/WD40-like Beta Propeller Repeat
VRKLLLASFLLLLFVAGSAQAQYFGKNKVQWERFDFKVLKTEHFDIYYYDREADVVNDMGRMAERWYVRLSDVFNHTFARKPIVLYANAADFHQTTTTPELIGQGTGGFTDPFMNRVVMPLTGDLAENDHVLGHELVHVFQFDVAASLSNNRRRFNLELLPLWLVEGMAEYFSKGRVDPLTAMWIRDATVRNRMPDNLRKLNDPRYFPYRYGESLMAYIGGRFGDDAVVRYFLAAGLSGPEGAFERALGVPSKQLFVDWVESAKQMYDPVLKDRPANLGPALISETRKGQRGMLNVGPALSPDGNLLAFLSTREIFDIDLFLADAKTGRVIRRLASAGRDPHMDALRFIDSAGAWSPDSKKLAIVTFEHGDNYLGIIDVDSGRIQHIRVPGIDSINTVAWSPDGHTIVMSAQTMAVSDLFLYDLESNQVRRLTNDKFADLQPAFSPDGKTVAFVTDRGEGAALEQLAFSDMTIATIDVASGSVHVLPLFKGAKHINPQFSPDGSGLYFIANPEGVADVYKYNFADGRVGRVTRVQTGVAGITDLSPALSVASRAGNIALSLFEDDNYNIYTLPSTQPAITLASLDLPPNSVPAGQLPPLRGTPSRIQAYLAQPERGLPATTAAFTTVPYSSSLHLAYVGPPSIGVGVSSFGTGIGGSVAAEFTDILGEHSVGFAIAGQGSSGIGTVGDQFEGEVFYLNQTHRVNWGADFSHLPYISAATGVASCTANINGAVVPADCIVQERQIARYDDLSGVVQYPFNTAQRVEFTAGVQRQSYKTEREILTIVGDQIVDDTTQQFGANFSFNLGRASTAFVGDTAVFGFLSPLRGSRYRYQVEALTGDLHFETALADYRHYWFARPVTFAIRGIHYGRYGRDAENSLIQPLYVGQSALVRGYEIDSIKLDECTRNNPNPSTCPVFDRLLGSKIAVVNAELRIPLFGTKEFGIFSGFIPTEVAPFIDAGLAWNQGDHPKVKFETNTNERVPVVSAGVTFRMLLSYIPLEFYWAKPFQRPGTGLVFGFNIIPGW